MTPSLSLVCWQVREEGWRSVLPCVTCWGPAALSAPVYAPGDTTGQDSWFVLEKCGVRQGGYGGAWWGMGLQMGRSRRGGRTGWTVRRITEHKRHVSKTEWAVTTYNPMDDNDIVLASTSGDLVQCVCVFVGSGGNVSWCPNAVEGWKRIETVGLWMDVIRAQMTNVWPTQRGNYNYAYEHFTTVSGLIFCINKIILHFYCIRYKNVIFTTAAQAAANLDDFVYLFCSLICSVV